jgi:riboflavin kinase/FMN adenylyltransferase
MKTFYGLNNFLRSEYSSRRLFVTIGVFDGIHKGHQKIIKTLVKKARRKRLSSALITFDPHPMNILGQPGKGVPLLISLKHRLFLLEEMGIDFVIVLRFNKKLSRMPAWYFIRKILGKMRVDEIIVGRNFFFGRKRSGSLKDLKKFSGIYGYKVNFISDIKRSGKVISSTGIRNLILKGDLKSASHLLSRPVTVLGTVVKGKRYGRIIGFRTANIDPHHEAIPPSGVYAVRIKVRKRTYSGILNIGVKPTFVTGSFVDRDSTIEAHIFDFNKHIYGTDVVVMFVKGIRKERKFKDAAGLRAQIAKDEKYARRILR